MNAYIAIKHFHLTCVVLSGLGFLTRGFWMLTAPEKLGRTWVRFTPHVVDTLLLVSALALAAWSHQWPFEQPWLTAKVIALLLYIGFGTIALKRGKSRAARTVALVLALLSFGYIVGAALTRNPWLI